MKDKINEINDLFSMFHDFEIVGLKLDNSVLTMQTLIPWSEMWDIQDCKITFRFSGCTNLKCNYWERTGSELIKSESGIYYPSKEYITSNLDEIIKLELDVQRHDFNEPNEFILHCNSINSKRSGIGVIEYGKIEMNANDYQVFDNKMKEITLDIMKEWATKWWDGIQNQ